MTGKWHAALAATALLSLAALPACAEDLKQDFERCKQISGDGVVEACTVLIESGKLTQYELGDIYASRGLAYEARGQHELSKQDLARACQLDDLNC